MRRFGYFRSYRAATTTTTRRAAVARGASKRRRVQARVITMLERQGDQVLIEQGVAPGERVATDNLVRLGDGVAVTE